jgi:hypothetical protein
MAQAFKLEGIRIDQVQALLVEHGCEVEAAGDNILKIRDLDSGITMRTVLEDNILFCTVTCMTVPAEKISQDVMKKMLDANNGISTSGFQLYDRGDGKVVVTLNNFCKLLEMGPDDEDDILSCLEFLAMDVYAARKLLADLD